MNNENIKMCNTCRFAKQYKPMPNVNYFEIRCMLWDMAYNKTDRCGSWEGHIYVQSKQRS